MLCDTRVLSTTARLVAALLLSLTTTLVHAEWSEPAKLGPNVNGPAKNHSPFVTADGKMLYFSSSFGGLNEDIYVCHWDSITQQWGPRIDLGPQFNTIQRELSPCQSPDGQYLWFVRWNFGRSYDLYYAKWDSVLGDWGNPQNAGPNFNSSCNEWAVSISPDGRRMFVDHGIRPGGPPCDIHTLWVSYWDDSAQWWDTLIYMGDIFNGLVRSASMSYDTSIIYFSSGNSYPNVPKFGSLEDLFVVSNNPPLWDSIDNLGMPVNSFERETSVAITSDGTTLYFASRRDTTKTFPDIYVSHWQEPTFSDSDRIWFEPQLVGSLFAPVGDTQFQQAVMINTRTEMLSLSIPITFNEQGSWWPLIPDLGVDTTVSEVPGILGVTFGSAGHDSLWLEREVVVDNQERKLLLRFVTDVPIAPLSYDTLCILHWRLSPPYGVIGAAKYDTIKFAGYNFRLQGTQGLVIPEWEWGAIFYGHVGVEDEPAIPERYTLANAYPNPFNAATSIRFTLSSASNAALKIYNVLGQHIQTLVDQPLPAGEHSITWNGTDDQGQPVGSGVYFYRLTVGEEVTARKMLLLK